MGGITFLFFVDFRQSLPIVTKGVRADKNQLFDETTYSKASCKKKKAAFS